MEGGGVSGAGKALGEGEWLRAYDRAAAIVPRVEALAAGRARLEAVNGIQHEFWEARDVLLQCRLLKADESRRRWQEAYMELQPSGDGGRFRELQNSDLEDLQTFVDLLDAENTEFKIEVKEVEGGAEHCQNTAEHEHIAGDLKAALRQLKQAYETLCSKKDKEVSALIAQKDKEVSALIAEKDKEVSSLISEKNKEVSALIAEKDFVREQFRTLERDYADLGSYSSKQAGQLTEAKQELEQLQVTSQKKDDEIRRLRARAKAVEAKRILLPEDTLQEMSCMAKETGGQICKDRQPGTSQKGKKVMSERHYKNCSEGPDLRREETKHYSSKQMLAKDGQPQTSQKRKRVTFLSNTDHASSDREENDSEHTLSLVNANASAGEEDFAEKQEVEQEQPLRRLRRGLPFGMTDNEYGTRLSQNRDYEGALVAAMKKRYETLANQAGQEISELKEKLAAVMMITGTSDKAKEDFAQQLAALILRAESAEQKLKVTDDKLQCIMDHLMS